MTEAVGVTNDQKASEKSAIGRIDIEQQVANVTEAEEDNVDRSMDVEKTIIQAVRCLLREYGVRKSGAAIRDAVEMPHDIFSTGHALSALSNLGFKTSFGSIKLSKIKPEMLPLIFFRKDGAAMFVRELTDGNKYICTKKNIILMMTISYWLLKTVSVIYPPTPTDLN